MSSSSTAFPTFSPLGFLPVTEKLTKNNHPMWKLQVMSALRGAEVVHFMDPAAQPPEQFLSGGEKKKEGDPPILNPQFKEWVAKDQQVLSYLLTSLSPQIGSQVTHVTTAAEVWATIEGLHASQSRAHIISTRMALATTTKGSSSVSEYFTKMKSLADEMASAGRKLEDEELVSYILTGLDLEFDSVVSAVAARVELITVNELYAQLVSFEQRVEARGGGQQSAANMATRDNRGGNFNNNSHGGGRGGRGGYNHG